MNPGNFNPYPPPPPPPVVNIAPTIIHHNYPGGTYPAKALSPNIGTAASQPVHAFAPAQQRHVRHPWSTGLCGCCEDCASCWITCCLPDSTFGKIAAAVDGDRNAYVYCGGLYCLLQMFSGLACRYSWTYRARMRELLSIREEPCQDFLVHCCCEHCALCTRVQGTQEPGYNVRYGWHGFVEGQHNSTGVPIGVGVPFPVPPQVEVGMKRY